MRIHHLPRAWRGCRRAAVFCAFLGLGLMFAAFAAVAGCRQGGSGIPDAVVDAAAETDSGYPPPRTDLVPALGSEGAIDIATWNIENFPSSPSTAAVVADLIASLDLDLIAVQEIASISSFIEVLDRLPGYSGLLSSHTYGDGSFQKIGFIYREAVLEPTRDLLLFENQGYPFPRPPMQVDFRVVGTDLDFSAITVHLKAGTGDDDIDRRIEANIRLEQYVRNSVTGGGDPDVIALGDFNERVIGARADEVMGPWLGSPADYTVHTVGLAEEGRYSFIPSGAILDHVVTSAALADELAGGFVAIPELDGQVFGYEAGISDHLPVVISMPVVTP